MLRSFGLFTATIVLLSSCEGTVQIEGATPDTDDPAGSGSSVTEVRRIVTTGPTLSFNTMSGGPSSIEINPVTKLPAMAYYDRNANVAGTAITGALKYAAMDSTGNWSIEVVDANYGTGANCGLATSFCVGAPSANPAASASFLRLAFKSDGTPAIAYAFGALTATTKQIRFAERSASGSWSVGVAFTATAAVAVATIEYPMKAITLNFDSSDRPHVTFHHYGATFTTGSQLKYLFRNSSGVWQPAVDIVSVASGTAAVAAVAGANQTGAAFCPANGKLLLMAFSMTAAATSDAIFIQSSTPATDGSLSFPAGSTVTVDNGCTGSTLCVAAGATGLTTGVNWGTTSAVQHGRFDLSVNPSGYLTTAYYSVANPANKLITATMASTCDNIPSSFSVAPAAGFLGTGLLVGSTETSPGLNGFRLATSSSDRWMSYTSNTAQEMRVSRVVTGAWFSPGLSVEGTLASLVATESIGIAYDSTNDLLYTSYAGLPGGAANALGNDVKVASIGGADVVSTASYPAFGVTVVDQTSAVFPTTAVPSVSAALAPNGTVGFALLYLDATFNDIKLYYGIKGGPALAPVFGMNNVVNYLEATAAATYPGSYPSLAYDSSSNPIIAFYSSVATGQYMESLQVARSFNGGASFSVTMVDDGSATASSAGIGQYPSVAVTGTTIGVSYYDGQTANTGLKFARYTPTTGWRKYVVDGMTGATGTGCSTTDDSGKYSRLVFTSAGAPVIAYQSSGNLKLAFGTATSATAYTWTCATVDASADTRGSGIGLALSTSDLPHLVHLDSSNNAIRYVTCASSVTSCITSGSGAFAADVLAFVGSVTADSATPHLKIASNGTRYVSFYSALEQGLILATRAAGASSWMTEAVEYDSSGASFVSGAGQYNSLILNSSSLPSVFYRSGENWLKFYSKE